MDHANDADESATNGHHDQRPTPTTSASVTAQDYISSQLRLESDAREALPYQFDACTQPLGPLRQSIFACLTCNPPPASKHQQFTPAGVCYSCSISCHGEHNLVELFSKRDFVCDCGTTRFTNSGTPCSLRLNAQTGQKGGVTGEAAREGNHYGQNFEGKFCGCGEEYDPEREKGTMFQCLGLGKVEQGGCGEDWWHPECLMGLPRMRPEEKEGTKMNGHSESAQPAVGEDDRTSEHRDFDDAPLPPGFPDEDTFDHLICYKCTNTYPWIKQYAGTAGFLPAVSADVSSKTAEQKESIPVSLAPSSPTNAAVPTKILKRKAEDDMAEDSNSQDSKKLRSEITEPTEPGKDNSDNKVASNAYHTTLPPAPLGPTTLFLQDDFRTHLCRCTICFPLLATHPQLLEEEESYEPPLSESSVADGDRNSVNSGSLLSRGEAALSSMDRVRAIEGVMAYNHVKEKVKEFLKPFAESGEVVGAEEIRAYFAALRGDEAVGEKGVGNQVDSSGPDGDHRREQGGY